MVESNTVHSRLMPACQRSQSAGWTVLPISGSAVIWRKGLLFAMRIKSVHAVLLPNGLLSVTASSIDESKLFQKASEHIFVEDETLWFDPPDDWVERFEAMLHGLRS